MKIEKKTAEEKAEEKKASKAFNDLVRRAKKKDALVSIEVIRR